MIKKKIKIIGSGPTGSLLALFLAHKNYNVTLIDPLTDYELCLKDKGYAITQSSKKIFEKIDLWKILKFYAQGFNSLSIIDDSLSKDVIIRTNDLKAFNKKEKDIGWVIEHKYLMQTLIDSINECKTIRRVNIDTTEDKNYDFIFAADGRDSSARKNWKICYLRRFYNQRALSFRARLIGGPKKRAYEIFRHEGPLALLPLENNIYQVIWFASPSETKERIKLSNPKLLEKLSNILPEKITPELIISEISNYSIVQAFAFPKFNNFQNTLVGEAAHSFHPVGGQGLNSCLRDVYELSEMLNNYESANFLYRKFFALRYFLNRSIDILSILLFTDFLIKLFSNKFIIFYPLRFLIFYVLKNFKIVRVNVFSLMTDSIKRI